MGNLGKKNKQSQALLATMLCAFALLVTGLTLWSLYLNVQSGAESHNLAWRGDFAAATAEARRVHKPILAVFTAVWCPACQKMKREAWSDVAVAEAANRVSVPVLVDVDDTQNEEVARRYQVQTIPRIILIDGDGRPLREAGYMSRAELERFISDAR